ncbi:MAG: hypothetical protein AB1Z98_28610 [Nannocystaceae bacterium]
MIRISVSPRLPLPRLRIFALAGAAALVATACGDDGPGQATAGYSGSSGGATSAPDPDSTTDTPPGTSTDDGDTTESDTTDGNTTDTGPGGSSVCDAEPPLAPPLPGGLRLQSEFGDPELLQVRTRGMWAIWWDPAFDHEDDAQWLFDRLDDVRCRAINDLDMADPPNPGNGVFYNVYIHHGDQDGFPNGWGNGQGTDGFGNPFLTLPNGAHLDEGNVNHEGFHVFQYSSDSPGFAYAGDSQWYVESTAQWYSAWRQPLGLLTFVEAGAIDGNPHLSLWHSFSNEAPGDPTDWMFQVRQYGMHTYLFYLTEYAGMDRDIITSGFYGGITVSPQQYHYDSVGADQHRSNFADWAAHNTADFDYLTPEQVERARQEVVAVGDPDNIHPYVAEYVDVGTAGQWLRPPPELSPRGWAYNVVRIDNTQAATYTLSLDGDPTGSEGDPSHFEGRVVVMTPAGAAYTDLTMSDPLQGEATVMVEAVEAADAEVFLVVASVAEHFGGNQTYGYQYRIDRR